MLPTFSAQEMIAYLPFIDNYDELAALHNLFFRQLKRYSLVDARAIAALLLDRKTHLLIDR